MLEGVRLSLVIILSYYFTITQSHYFPDVMLYVFNTVCLILFSSCEQVRGHFAYLDIVFDMYYALSLSFLHRAEYIKDLGDPSRRTWVFS